MTRRGRCRCGKVLKFRLGPEGYKRRCGQCGAVVRLTDHPTPRPPRRLPDPAWTYAPTEEVPASHPGRNLDATAWVDTDAQRPLPFPPALPTGGRQAAAPALAEIEIVAVEPPVSWHRIMLAATLAALVVVAAVGLLIHYLRGGPAHL